ncbi:uncharacterized protein Dvar_65690 [Desulfosarcina variabilis str. Montpellier]
MKRLINHFIQNALGLKKDFSDCILCIRKMFRDGNFLYMGFIKVTQFRRPIDDDKDVVDMDVDLLLVVFT